MNRTFAFILTMLGLVAPLCARAATVAPTSIPDGTYTVKVEKIIDNKHVQVLMANGSETTLTAGRTTVDFTKIQPSDSIKISLINGTVMVYLDLGPTTH